MTTVFDGRQFATKKEEELRKKIFKFSFKPKLVAILVGEDPASKLYVNLKKKAAERVGIGFEVKEFPGAVSEEEVKREIEKLNADEQVHGIMVQLPLPEELRGQAKEIVGIIKKEKDVDGLREDSPFLPATTKGIAAIVAGKKGKVVVVGSRGTVGKSVMKEFGRLGYEVVGVDVETKDLGSVIREADILISATGKPGLIKGDMVKEGAVVVDVGSPKGDVDFGEVSKKASFVTPVPGGVGPVTVVSLLENLVQACV